MVYTVYMVECCDRTLYTGYTSNLKQRLYAHNHLKSGASYTKQRRPVVLVYFEEYETLGEALRREYEIKRLKRWQKEELIDEYQRFLEDNAV
jgi:putative endonuclease